MTSEKPILRNFDPPTIGTSLSEWKRIRVELLDCADTPMRKRALEEVDGVIKSYEDGWRLPWEYFAVKQQKWPAKMLSSARSRAKSKGVPFTLTKRQLVSLINKAEGVCAISNVHFQWIEYEDSLVKYPLAPSIDRIDPKKGYTKDNCRIVCTAVNFAINQWGAGVLGLISHGMMAPAFDYLDDMPEIEHWYLGKHSDQRVLKNELKVAKGENKNKLIRKLAAIRASETKGPIRQKRIWERIRNTRA